LRSYVDFGTDEEDPSQILEDLEILIKECIKYAKSIRKQRKYLEQLSEQLQETAIGDFNESNKEEGYEDISSIDQPLTPEQIMYFVKQMLPRLVASILNRR
jgi:hypothetical protein